MITYLYVKQHRVTKLLYFGKTTKNDPEKYNGSGTYWLKHIKKHGKYIDTLCIWEFDSQEDCCDYALTFSKENDIINSVKWANLVDESGLDGGMLGRQHSDATKLLMKQNHKSPNFKKENHPNWGKRGTGTPMFGKTHSEETKQKIKETSKLSENTGRFKKGFKHSLAAREKMSKSRKGRIPWNKGIMIDK